VVVVAASRHALPAAVVAASRHAPPVAVAAVRHPGPLRKPTRGPAVPAAPAALAVAAGGGPHRLDGLAAAVPCRASA
jgi:hypothetical protein